MLPLATSLFIRIATGAGGVAAMIAVGAFLGQVIPGLTGAPEPKLRRETVLGGIGGLAVAVFLIVLSAT